MHFPLGVPLWAVFLFCLGSILYSLRLKGCAYCLSWFLLGMAIVGVVWLLSHGVLRL